MRLTTTTDVSVDGVMQGLGGPDNEVYGGGDMFQFGRRTHQIFAGYRSAFIDPGIAAALNSRPKHVVSTTLTGPRWADTTVLTGDIAVAVRDLEAQQDGELVVPGSGGPGQLTIQLPGYHHPDLSACGAPAGRNRLILTGGPSVSPVERTLQCVN